MIEAKTRSEWLIDRAWEALAALGGTADEVAESLRKEGVKGIRNNPCACPLAALLARRGLFCEVLGGLGLTLRTEKYPEHPEGPLGCAIPQGALSFVGAFDDGAYPDLREWP